MQLAKASHTVTMIFILLSVILLYMLNMDYYNQSNTSQLSCKYSIYQKDHNGNKQDLSAFCAILGYIYIIMFK